MVAHYLTSKKRAIGGTGLTSEYVVEMKPVLQFDPHGQRNAAKDTQLQKATEVPGVWTLGPFSTASPPLIGASFPLAGIEPSGHCDRVPSGYMISHLLG